MPKLECLGTFTSLDDLTYNGHIFFTGYEIREDWDNVVVGMLRQNFQNMLDAVSSKPKKDMVSVCCILATKFKSLDVSKITEEEDREEFNTEVGLYYAIQCVFHSKSPPLIKLEGNDYEEITKNTSQ